MKHFVLAVAVTFCAGTAVLAQTSAVTNAYMYRKDGKLEEARKEIDQAITHEKTMGNAKTWYFRGDIYEALAFDKKYKDKAPADAVKIAYDSYQKATELDKKNGEYASKSADRMKAMYAPVFNSGVKSLQDQKYDDALKSFAIARTMRPSDTTTLLYTGYAAEGKQDWALAKESYRSLLKVNPRNKETHQRLLRITRDIEKNDAETMQVLEAALKEYPNDKDFMLAEVNMYIAAKRQDEAIAKLEKALAVDPKNPNLYAALGSLYDGIKNSEKAMANYTKAIEMDPANFDAQYNMGVYQYNKAAEIFQRIDAMDFATFQKSGKKLEEDAKKYFTAAAGYFEKALTIQKDDIPAMESLKTIYSRLGRAADAQKMDAQIKATREAKKAK